MLGEEHVRLAMELIRAGYDEKRIRQKLGLSKEEADEAIEVARARMRARDKFSRDDLWLDLEGLRYATHELVADYRGKRLREQGVKSIADVSCGVGIQVIFFAKHGIRAIGVDIDPKKVEYARRNAEKFGVKVEFIHGDALSPEVIGRIDAQVVFSDPARPPEVPERSLEGLLPSPLKVYEVYKERVEAFIFDLPPQIRREKVPWKGEFEYIDLFGHLNRLTFYTEPLAKAERSAVILPQGVRLESNPDLEPIVEWTNTPGHYLYEIPQAVDYADLINELFHAVKGELKLLLREKRRVLATGEEELRSPYFKRAYVVVATMPFHPVRINDFLRKEGYGRATLRISVPDSEYWRIRKKIEAGLRGERRAFVFQVGNTAVIAEELGKV
ncbi:class I SAM-dependent methyltransferase [Pyrococcus yayanosii]|uniref:Methyltransferase n=1 Tax=Pyrococcus yayanosii (strain CH1 / JCM 16557) TaxID=529709 RepID=F8AF50_PYRYC|nr:class I SAM-dependent methyltransferase [Pyrococcus yayanosii]AEH23724.1 methyltransferase [Pyrococcus yayanosii CH1]